MLLLSKLAATPTFSLLYSGLEPGASGEIVEALEQQSVAFEIRGSSIFVDSARRDELRMTLATSGLPTLDGKGYELLDNLSGFGTTAQMFDAAYWRAKEGELARTIVAGAQIKNARVHIANASAQPFRRNAISTASVTATSTSGRLLPVHAKALRYLVASAVAGLSPENVSIIDGRNGVVVSGETGVNSLANSGDRAEKLKNNVKRLLEARVGSGNAVVEINLETVTESEAITEIRIDPESRVAISSDSEERTTSSKNNRGNSVTVASNLPSGDNAGTNNESSNQNTETRERINYEVSETRREILRAPGAIKRVSTAVLIDGKFVTDDQTGQSVWTPRSEKELEELKELVAAAVGFDEERGDTLTLKSMEFRQIETEGFIEPPSFLQKLNLDIMRLIQVGVVAIVTLVLGLFVLRPIFSKTPLPVRPGPQIANIHEKETSLDRTHGSVEIGSESPSQIRALTGEIDTSNTLPTGFPSASDTNASVAMIPGLPLSQSDPVDRLRQITENRQDETVEILRNWIENSEERV
ncbi:MAG: flagellar basal-body MS-ring/collar protein FliF [Paracoccaceae bacterium]